MADITENTSADTNSREKLKQEKELLSSSIENEIKKIFSDPSGESFQSFLKASGKLHTSGLSFRNTVLAAAQKPNATFTMGYKDWQAAGYQVKKGARSIKMFTPEFAKNYSENGLANHLLKSLDNQLENQPAQPAEYALGSSGYKFVKDTNGDLSVSVNGKPAMQFKDTSHLQNYVNKYVVGKVPVSMSVGAVFDIADTYALKDVQQQKLVKPAQIKENDTEKAELLLSVLKKVRPHQERHSFLKDEDRTPYNEMVDTFNSFSIARGLEKLNSLKDPAELKVVGEIGLTGRQFCMSEVASQCFGAKYLDSAHSAQLGKMAVEWGEGKTQNQLEDMLVDIFKDCKALLRDIEKALDDKGLDLSLEPKQMEKMTTQEKDVFIKNTLKTVDSKAAQCEETKKELASDYHGDAPMKPTIKMQGYLVKDMEAKLKDVSAAVNKLREPVKPHIENSLVKLIDSALADISQIEGKFNELASLREAHGRDDKDSKDTLSSQEWGDSMDKLVDSKDNQQEQKEQQTAKDTQNKAARQEAGAAR